MHYQIVCPSRPTERRPARWKMGHMVIPQMEFADRIAGHNSGAIAQILWGGCPLHRKPKETVRVVGEFSDPVKMAQQCIKLMDQIDKHGAAPTIPAAKHYRGSPLTAGWPFIRSCREPD